MFLFNWNLNNEVPGTLPEFCWIETNEGGEIWDKQTLEKLSHLTIKPNLT